MSDGERLADLEASVEQVLHRRLAKEFDGHVACRCKLTTAVLQPNAPQELTDLVGDPITRGALADGDTPIAVLAAQIADDQLRVHRPNPRINELLVRGTSQRLHRGVEAVVDLGMAPVGRSPM